MRPLSRHTREADQVIGRLAVTAEEHSVVELADGWIAGPADRDGSGLPLDHGDSAIVLVRARIDSELFLRNWRQRPRDIGAII